MIHYIIYLSTSKKNIHIFPDITKKNPFYITGGDYFGFYFRSTTPIIEYYAKAILYSGHTIQNKGVFPVFRDTG